ncbi:DUF4231 domain-containing protein [Saccharothrix sp. Mg75]|uniref:DUF4231 domain-containing protein n=1 Tax=Saccharothrix sp. Mg75 TaxID=3445357 RepID=UPI003EEC52AD
MTDADLPGFYRDADGAATVGRDRTLRWNRLRLVGAVLAALGGALSWKLGAVQVWAVVAVLGFALALLVEVVLAFTHPEEDWYRGRAVAEGVKTLAWRFAVAGDPFPLDLDARAARTALRSRVREVLARGRDRVALAADDPYTTERMVELRGLPFEQRRAAYRQHRVREQKSWYTARARDNARLALRWRVGLIVGELVALGLAGCRALGLWELDLSGVLAAAVAAGAAWMGLRRHSALAATYAAAARELAMVDDELRDVDEDGWAAAVASAEEAVNREHALWLASRPAES